MTIQRQSAHGHFRRLAILLCLTGLIAQEAQATPTRHTWVRATPLGVNETSYFYLLMEHRNPGSHYSYTESLILVRRDIRNGRLLERIKLRETEFADVEDNNVWQKKELPSAGVDLGKYLRKLGVQMVFPTELPSNWKIKKNQLVTVEDGKTQVLASESVMVQPLAELVPEFGEPKGDHEFRIGAAFESRGLPGSKTPQGTLVIIEFGKAEYESNFCQHVVFVPDSSSR